MTNLTELQNLVDRFHANIDFYKDARNAYNEHSCRIEYIDPLLKLLGWDVANEKGLAPQYREVIAENYSTRTDRPDYTITLRGVPKFFVEAKKPAVDITRVAAPAIQTRKYGWNAKHRLAVLTNFEYLAIYDTCHIAHEDDGWSVYFVKRNFSSDLMGMKDIRTGKITFDEGVVYEMSDDKFIFNLMNFPKHSCFEMTNLFDILKKNYKLIEGVGENGGYHAQVFMSSLFSQMDFS